jgi:hypothetical protein
VYRGGERVWAAPPRELPFAFVAPQHLVLVPGFFGFDLLGRFSYFSHVERGLAARMQARRGAGRIVTVKQHPTASLVRRAARLLETIDALLTEEDGEVHLIGHSTGGLDARLVLSEHVRLPTQASRARLDRVRTVVAVSAPHYGSPLAFHWLGPAGQTFIRLLSLVSIATMERSGLEARLLQLLLRVLGSADHLLEPGGLLDDVFRQLLDQLTPESRKVMQEFFRDVEQDRSLLGQLEPSPMHVFDALVHDPPTVRMGAVVTWIPPRSHRLVDWGDLVPWHAVSRRVFDWLHDKTSRPQPPAGAPTPAHRDKLARVLGVVPAPGDNDGFVPTLSQIRGELVHVTIADHVDTIGHYHAPHSAPPHYDWFDSGAGFGSTEFEALWDDVVSFLFAA